MSVRSRAPWRPTLPEACRSFSTSAGVRYSRERRSRLEVRRGGVREEGAAADRGLEDPTVRRRSRTFPFWGIGTRLAATDFFEALAIAGHHTFPIRVIYGNVASPNMRLKMTPQCAATFFAAVSIIGSGSQGFWVTSFTIACSTVEPFGPATS